MTVEDPVVARRLTSQLLAGPRATTPEEVVRRVLAVQAQDPRGFRLAVRSRSKVSTAADVDAALASRRLIVSWLNRGTLHLVVPDDYWWLHPLTTPQLATGNARRLAQEGVTPRQGRKGVDVVVDALRSSGPLTRAQLRDRLDAAAVPTAGQALVHVLFRATLEGHVVRGPMIGGDHAFVSVPEWLGPAPPPLPKADALALLATRYLNGHYPAEPADLAVWAGITVGDARAGMAAADPPPRRKAGRQAPILLGAFDPLLHGWASRAAVVGPHRKVVTTNGVFRPVALVDGRVVATWGMPRGVVTIEPLEPIPDAVLAALRVDAAAVARFLGGELRSPHGKQDR